MSLRIIIIRNPLKPELRDIRDVDFVEGKSLAEYTEGITFLRGTNLVAAIDGHLVKGSWNDVFPSQGSIVSISAETEASGVAAWVATKVGVAIASATASAVAGYAAAIATYAVVYVATSLVIGYGINMLANALGDTPDANMGGADQSPTYSWGPLRPTETEGLPIPIVLGTHKIAGQVINKYTEVGDDNKEYLNMLLVVHDGLVEDITDIKINEQFYTNFKKVDVFTRLGSLDDTPIENFNQIVQQRNPGINLIADDDDPETSEEVPITTEGNAVEAIRIVLAASYGLYTIKNDGDLGTISVKVKVEYRPLDEEGNPVGNRIDHGVFTISGDQNTAIRKTIEILDLEPSKYEVFLNRLTQDYESHKTEGRVFVEGFKEIVDEALSYPGLAKYGINALATDQLSGQAPSVTCVVKNSTVSVYNPYEGQNVEKEAGNFAWMAYAFLVNHHNINHEDLIYDEFYEWATYMDQLAEEAAEGMADYSKYGIVFDNQSTVWENVQRIATLGRAKIIRRGTKFGVFIDQPSEEVTHMFTMGNIIDDTFSMQYLPMKDRANAIEITYLDPDKNYTNNVISLFTEEYTKEGTVPKKSNIKYNCAMPESRAYIEGRYLLQSNYYLTRTLEFEAGINTFDCVVGDLVYFQHDIPDYGNSIGGRIVSATEDTVTLDQQIELEEGIVYKIMVFHGDDTLEEKTVSVVTSDVTVSTLNLDTAWNKIPERYDVYMVGKADTYKKKYRITNISRAQDNTRRITLLEYLDEIFEFDESIIISPSPLYTQEAVRVKVHEFLTYAKDGGYQSNLAVSWHPANEAVGSNWIVWIMDITEEDPIEDFGGGFDELSSEEDWIKCGETTKNSFIIGPENLNLKHYYRIMICPVDEGLKYTNNNSVTTQVLGKLAPPSDVTSFNATFSPHQMTINFWWSPIDDIDASHYEIRVGDTWEDSVHVLSTQPIDPEDPDEPEVGANIEVSSDQLNKIYTYLIKAIDTSGVKSENAKSTSITLPEAEEGLPAPEDLVLESYTEVNDANGEVVGILEATWSSHAEAHEDLFSHYRIVLQKELAENLFTSSDHVSEENQYQWNGVIPGVKYCVRVAAVDIDGKTYQYSIKTCETIAANTEPPPAPGWADLALIPGFKVMGIKWTKPDVSDVDYYNLERENISGEISYINEINGTHFTDIDLKAGAQYCYRVQAVNTSGTSGEWSAQECETTLEIGLEDVAYRTVRAHMIDVDYLSAISARAGVLTAGHIVSESFLEQDFVENVSGELVFEGAIPSFENWEGSYFNLNDGLLFMGNTNPQSQNYFFWDGMALNIRGLINSWNAMGDATKIDGGQIYVGSQIQIGNLDGISDYVIFDAGNIEFFRYFPDGKHRMVHAVKRIDFGVAYHGEVTDLSGYWAMEPVIQVWPKRIPLYLSSHSNRSQELVCEVQEVNYNPTTGRCSFIPRVFATYAGDDDDQVQPKETVDEAPEYEGHKVSEGYTDWYDIWGITRAFSIPLGTSTITVYWEAGCSHVSTKAIGRGDSTEYVDYYPEQHMRVEFIVDEEYSFTVFDDVVNEGGPLVSNGRTNITGDASDSLDPETQHSIKMRVYIYTFHFYDWEYSNQEDAYSSIVDATFEAYQIGGDFSGETELATGTVEYVAMELKGENETTGGTDGITCTEYIPPAYLEFNFSSDFENDQFDLHKLDVELCSNE